jgi:hypothetical protein
LLVDAPNGLLITSLFTNLQKTNKQKLAGNAAQSDTNSRKFMLVTHKFSAENYSKEI